MKFASQFSSENLLMSVGGHLALVAIMITSFVVITERAKLVAPDRIQIMEIDLNSVRVTGDETRLYNTDAPEIKPAVETPKPEPEKTSEPVPVTTDVDETPALAEIDDTPIETPSLVQEVKPTPEPKQEKTDPVPAPEKTPDPAPAPKKKTVIRVNREVLSLDRTLTVSVVDALRVAMTRCWTIDTTRPDISDIRAVAHLTMRKNGTVRDVWFESAARAETDPAFAYVLDTIRDAINVCQPFKMLPENEFSKWEKIQLTFYPTQGKVM